MIKVKIIPFILLCFLCTIFSCEKEYPKLTRAHNSLLDSLTKEGKTGLRLEMDSLCDLRFAKELNQLTDSIVEDRMNEIRRKIEADAKKK